MMPFSSDGPAIIVLSPSSIPVAEEIKALSGGEIHALRNRVERADILFDNAAHHVGGLYLQGRVLIGVMASGALLRLIAPHLGDKLTDPAVLRLRMMAHLSFRCLAAIMGQTRSRVFLPINWAGTRR